MKEILANNVIVNDIHHNEEILREIGLSDQILSQPCFDVLFQQIWSNEISAPMSHSILQKLDYTLNGNINIYNVVLPKLKQKSEINCEEFISSTKGVNLRIGPNSISIEKICDMVRYKDDMIDSKGIYSSLYSFTLDENDNLNYESYLSSNIYVVGEDRVYANLDTASRQFDCFGLEVLSEYKRYSSVDKYSGRLEPITIHHFKGINFDHYREKICVRRESRVDVAAVTRENTNQQFTCDALVKLDSGNLCVMNPLSYFLPDQYAFVGLDTGLQWSQYLSCGLSSVSILALTDGEIANYLEQVPEGVRPHLEKQLQFGKMIEYLEPVYTYITDGKTLIRKNNHL